MKLFLKCFILPFMLLFVLEAQGSSFVDKRSYSISIPEASKVGVEIYSSTSGPLIVLSAGNIQSVYDAKSGQRIMRSIGSEEIIRPLEFVGANDVSPALNRMGCVRIFPGCTTPEDADFVLKVESTNSRSLLKIDFYDLTRLRERFETAMKGTEYVQFEPFELELIGELVAGTSGQVRGTWRDSAIRGILLVSSLENVSTVRRNLQQFRFRDSTSLLPKRRLGDSTIEESLLDVVDQITCRLLGGAIVNGYADNKNNSQWLASAMQEGMMNRCSSHSVQFRVGLLDSPFPVRTEFSKALKRLACVKQSADFWCASMALEGKLCESTEMDCGSGQTPPQGNSSKKMTLSDRLASSDVVTKQDSRMLEYARVTDATGKGWLPLLSFRVDARDSKSNSSLPLYSDDKSIGLTFLARPVSSVEDGEFEITVMPSKAGANLMNENHYAVVATFLLEITRKDVCKNGLLCIFPTSDKEHRRIEQRSALFELNPRDFVSRQTVKFGKLNSVNGRMGLSSELAGVRLMIDRVTPSKAN